MALFQLRQVTHKYGDKTALAIDALTLEKGSITGLSGPNGSGKTTLLKILAFVRKPSEGTVLFKNSPAEPFSEAVRSKVTFLSQTPCLMKRSVFANVAHGLKLRKETENLTEKVGEALNAVGLPPEKFAERNWHELSGGEAKRVALASRLALKPEVLILDEPTANVDAESCQLIREASLTAKSEWGTTLVISSHDSQWLYGVCDQVLNLFNGHLRKNGRSNIIFGPWTRKGEGHYEKTGTAGETVLVPEPPAPHAVAMIPPEAITLLKATAPRPAGQITIRGALSGLDLDKRSGDIFASVTVGATLFSAKVGNTGQAPDLLCPGTPVTLSYAPEAVTWYSKG